MVDKRKIITKLPTSPVVNSLLTRKTDKKFKLIAFRGRYYISRQSGRGREFVKTLVSSWIKREDSFSRHHQTPLVLAKDAIR
jgi:TPP-dependent pyruvate/acetoin dehydrogenase alpha subunit